MRPVFAAPCGETLGGSTIGGAGIYPKWGISAAPRGADGDIGVATLWRVSFGMAQDGRRGLGGRL